MAVTNRSALLESRTTNRSFQGDDGQRLDLLTVEMGFRYWMEAMAERVAPYRAIKTRARDAERICLDNALTGGR